MCSTLRIMLALTTRPACLNNPVWTARKYVDIVQLRTMKCSQTVRLWTYESVEFVLKPTRNQEFFRTMRKWTHTKHTKNNALFTTRWSLRKRKRRSKKVRMQNSCLKEWDTKGSSKRLIRTMGLHCMIMDHCHIFGRTQCHRPSKWTIVFIFVFGNRRTFHNSMPSLAIASCSPFYYMYLHEPWPFLTAMTPVLSSVTSVITALSVNFKSWHPS